MSSKELLKYLFSSVAEVITTSNQVHLNKMRYSATPSQIETDKSREIACQGIQPIAKRLKYFHWFLKSIVIHLTVRSEKTEKIFMVLFDVVITHLIDVLQRHSSGN